MPYKIRTIQCAYCGKQVTKPMGPDQKFCSLQCFAKSRKKREVRECSVCKREFEVRISPSRYENAGQFCSRKCKGIASRRHDPRPCELCGRVFQPFFNTSKRYCSSECGKEAKRLARRTGETRTCEQCGKEFYVPKARLKTARFCSLQCLNEWQGRNKLSFTCKICGKPFKWSPSRITDGNPTYCSVQCYRSDPESRKHIMEMVAKQQYISPNKLELAGYAILDSLGLTYVKQKSIADKFIVDAFLPDHDVIIQFDGDYWHGNPERFPEPDERQKKRMDIDASQNAYFRTCGYKVLRFWGSIIRKNPSWVKQQISSALSQINLVDATYPKIAT